MAGQEVVTIEASAVGAIVDAEINQQVATARRYPRSEQAFYSKAKALVLASEETAVECIYALPRDSKFIEGPSARMAEILAHCWGNNRVGARVLGLDDSGRFIVAQGVFHDLETNVARSVEIRRRITTAAGKIYSDDMIGTTANAAASIAMREATLKGIPRAVWGEIYAQARALVTGTIEGIEKRREAALKAFQLAGLSQEIMLKIVGKRGMRDIEPNDLLTLRGVLVAMRDGDISAQSLIRQHGEEPEAGNGGKPDIGATLRRQPEQPPAEAKEGPKPAPAPEAPAQADTAATEAPAQAEAPSEAQWTPEEQETLGKLQDALAKVATIDDILRLTNELGPSMKGQRKAFVDVCNDALAARRHELAKKPAAARML